MPQNPFRLVPDQLSHDTVETLRTLLKQAEDGLIIGVAFAVMYRGRFFVASTTGECFRNPIWSIGMVGLLDQKLRRLAEVGQEDM